MNRNLLLCLLLGAAGTLAAQATSPRIDSVQQMPGPTDSWPTYNGDYSGRRFSPLTRISAANVGALSLAWMYRINLPQGTPAVRIAGTPLQVDGVLTGEAKAGAAFFNGEGKCSTCHATTASNLNGIGGRYNPVDLQQRFLFPSRNGRGGAANPGAAVTVTVTPASGAAVSGVLVQMDDFDVTLRDAGGAIRTFHRTPALKVTKTDPLDAHHRLLDTISDKQMHDVVAYLASLK